MIPKNYKILQIDEDPMYNEIFFSSKKWTCCESGLKYPIMVAVYDEDKNTPFIQVSNDKKWVPVPIPGCTNSFNVSVSKNPVILTPDTCEIDPRDVHRIFQWIKINYDKIVLMHWMFERDILKYLDEDTNIIYSHSSVLGTMKRVKRKTKKRNIITNQGNT